MTSASRQLEFWTAYVDLEHMVFWWSQSWDMGASAPLYFGGQIYRDLYPFLSRQERQLIQDMLTVPEPGRRAPPDRSRRWALRLVFRAGRGPMVVGNPSPPNDMGETPSLGEAESSVRDL